jgi:hypothetical protein
MFAVLDTDHFPELVRGSPAGGHLQDQIESRKAQVFVSVITAQETFEGWFDFLLPRAAGPLKYLLHERVEPEQKYRLFRS